jgi:NADPH-dependent curcumin reductase CurA
MPTPDNFEFADAEIPQPKDGEVLVRTLYISVDPYLRGRMREGRSYVPPFEVGQVIESGAVGLFTGDNLGKQIVKVADA